MDWTGIADGDLARHCRRGDAAAWRELVRRTAPTAWRVALRMLGTAAEAEDACQEVFLRVHRSFDTFDATRPLRPWVARITYHACLRQLGAPRRAELAVGPEALAAVVDEAPATGDSRATEREAAERLGAALATLPAQDRALVVMRYREGLSDAEVAEATGMPVGTVKTRLFRARGRLRNLLAPLFGRKTEGTAHAH